MKHQAFRRELADLTPDMPEAFHRRVEAFLQDKVDQEVNMKETTKQKLYTGGRIGSRALVFALVAALLLATAAVAATQWGVFDSLTELFGTQPPLADSVMQANIHRETVNGVEIAVLEAGYDGRTLLMQYSYRLSGCTDPLGTIDERTGRRMLSDDELSLLDEYQIGWWVDAFWINGQCMDMAENSGSIEQGGNKPGEIIRTDYWRLDNLDVALTGQVEIALPIGARPDAAYRKSLYDKENSCYRLPEQSVVTFSFDASDILSRVVTLNPNIDTVTPEVTARVSEAAFTPLMTYITLDLEANPNALAAFKAIHGEGFCDENGALLWPYAGMDVYGSWISSLQLVDGNGQPLFPGHMGCNGYNSEWAEFTFPYVDVQALPQELYLAAVTDGTADMAAAVRVK